MYEIMFNEMAFVKPWNVVEIIMRDSFKSHVVVDSFNTEQEALDFVKSKSLNSEK